MIVRIVCCVLVWILSCAGAAAQVLQPGDTIAIGVYQDSKLDRQLVIGPTGQISFPLAGQIRAGGLTPEGLEKALKARLKDKYTAQLDITVTVVATAKPDEEQKARFFVTGEVNRPGPQILRPGTTVLQAISMAGGVAQFAAKKRIQIRRTVDGQETTLLFDYAAFERGGSAAGNIELRAGDVIIVPERGLLE
jgi:polysaccharide biosynthesis/export protein